MFTRKHYVAMAKVLCETHKTQPECGDTISYITSNLAEMFEKDNPRFDKELFVSASYCEVVRRRRGRKSRSGLRMFGAGEAYRPPIGSTVITSEGVYRSRRRRR